MFTTANHTQAKEFMLRSHSWGASEENQRETHSPKEKHLLERESQAEAAPLVSVVIPCYKQAHFLGEAIESVLAQSYPHFEIIVVDDGSPDNTSEVAARYARVRCIRQDNQGLAGARNTGIRESKGSYLVFLDADDRLLPDALKVGVECLKARPECAFVSGLYRFIAADGSPLPPIRDLPCPDKEQYMEMLRGDYIITPAVIMHRRSVFEVVGGFDSSVNAAADYDLCLRVARKFPVYCHGEVIIEYRLHASNMTLDSVLMLNATLDVLHSQWRHTKGNKPYKEAIKKGIRVSKDHYGGQLAYRMLAHAQKREWKNALRDMLLVLRYYPRVFIRAWRKLKSYGHLQR
jgi:glycosyltransferase involved in cell wall biosynthesis